MSESLNFTQFCAKYGYPCDYDMMFEAQYNGSLRLAGHVSNRTINKVQETARANRERNNQAHAEYIDKIINGEVIDPSGEYVKEKIIAERIQRQNKAIQTQIDAHNTNIQWIESLGKMSHLANGKLKKGYQLAVDDYKNKIAELSKNLTVGAFKND